MPLWKTKALELIRQAGQNPDQAKFEKIRSANSPMMLWIELYPRFINAHREPQDLAFIQKVYDYARWCINTTCGPDSATDPSTAAIVAFYEHLPTEAMVRSLIPQFLSRAEFEELLNIFRYHLSEDELKTFKNETLLQYRGK